MDRREFAALLPALLSGSALVPESLEAQSCGSAIAGVGGFKPSPAKAGSQAGHSSSRYLAGMLKAGNIRLEMHESTIQPGAEHEAVGTHLHSEIWLVREGTAELTTNGVARNDGGWRCGDLRGGGQALHRESSDKPVTYFVVTVGPPE